MAKLTLSVEDSVVSRAKQYARLRRVSISEIVENYLAVIAEPPAHGGGTPPILRSVRGVLKSADKDEYRKHLTTKYR
jgi:hypothetical protein